MPHINKTSTMMSSFKSSQSQVSHGGEYSIGPKQIQLELHSSSGEQPALSRTRSNSFSGRSQKGSSTLESTCFPAVHSIENSNWQWIGKNILKNWPTKLWKLLKNNENSAGEGGTEAATLLKKGQ